MERFITKPFLAVSCVALFSLLVYDHLRTSKRNERRSNIPKPGDLVVVRNHAVDNQHEKKLILCYALHAYSTVHSVVANSALHLALLEVEHKEQLQHKECLISQSELHFVFAQIPYNLIVLLSSTMMPCLIM